MADFVLRLPLLLTLTAVISTLLTITPALCSSNALYSDLGNGLGKGQSLAYRDYTLTLQPDCNLVLYNGSTAIWHTNTAQKGPICILFLQPNGELLLFGRNGREVVWRSGITSTVGSYALVVKYDGTLQVYGPSIWSVPDTNANVQLITAERSSSTGDEAVPDGLTDSTLWTGDIATMGPIVSNGDYRLTLDEKCNLTLSNAKTGVATWASNSKDRFVGDCYVDILDSGALFIKHLGGSPLWINGASGVSSDYVLALRPDGKLVVYGPTIWSSVRSSESAAGSGVAGKIAMVTTSNE